MTRRRLGSRILLGGVIAVCSTGIAGHVMAASYHNGRVLSSVQVVPVFWGPNVNSNVVNYISGYFKTVVNSPYLDSLDEYYSVLNQPIGRGTVLKSSQTGSGWQITPTTYTGSQPTETNVANELANQIKNGAIPFPTANILYFVFFPPGYTISGSMCGTSCGYCGCHVYTTQNLGMGGTWQFPFALMPDNSSSGGCNANNCGLTSLSQFENIQVTASHELVEAITDPFGNGWWPEIGDSCQDNLGTPSNQWFLFGDAELAVQKIWSNAANGCITVNPKCQEISDFYGIAHSYNSQGFAPTWVQDYYILNSCTTDPTYSWDETERLCQNASDLYGITSGISPSPSYVPASVADWDYANGCGTKPQDPVVSTCQRASNSFGIYGGGVPAVSLGSSDPDAESYWYNNSCYTVATAPTVYDICTAAASMYRIQFVGHWDFGWAPIEVRSWWNSLGCSSGPAISIQQACQFASNMYGIVAWQTFGGAPANVQTWWSANNCTSSPTCAGVSEMFGTNTGLTWGAAPSWIQSWWNSQNGGFGCSSQPKYGTDPCQALADTFGMVENLHHGFAPLFVQSFWTSNNCHGHPRSNLSSFATDMD